MSPAAQPTLPQQKNGQTSGDLYECEQRLSESLQKLSRVVVAFSGGVDSALLAYSALACLGPDKVLAVTADSDSLAQGELEHCGTTAARWGLPWLSVQTQEFHNPAYLVNGADRCFWCKDALMDALNPVAEQRAASVVLGVNVDDLGDHRPGQLAAQERGALFPLVEAGLDKASIRALALHYGLEVWDRPAMPCLASRIPYGTAVSVALLRSVDRAEAAVRGFGFSDVRVRHYGETARIEVPVSELAAAVALSEQLVAALTALGFSYVTLDLAGLRSGNLNQALLPTGSSS